MGKFKQNAGKKNEPYKGRIPKKSDIFFLALKGRQHNSPAQRPG